MKAWASRDSFRWESTFQTWFYEVAKSVLITNLYRKKGPALIYPIKMPDSIDLLEGDVSVLEDLNKAVQKLNTDDRDLVMLYFDEKSQREIAQMTNTSEKNVASRFKRIKAKLRRLLNVTK